MGGVDGMKVRPCSQRARYLSDFDLNALDGGRMANVDRRRGRADLGGVAFSSKFRPKSIGVCTNWSRSFNSSLAMVGHLIVSTTTSLAIGLGVPQPH